MVPYNVAYLGEGRFHKGVAGDLYAERRAGARSLAEAVRGSPGVLKLSDDMLGLAWGKLLINLNNAVNALSGKTLIDELKRRGLLTRDARQKERRKAGLKKARKRPQFSKR